MDYNAFRRYRTSMGVRGSAQELADAWREYAETAAEVERSPRRTSPRRSPVRYAGLSSASLTGLPPDVRRMVLPRVGRKEVHALKLASRGTGGLVEEHLRRLCASEVTVSELVGALPHLHLPVSVRVFVSATPRWPAHLSTPVRKMSEYTVNEMVMPPSRPGSAIRTDDPDGEGYLTDAESAIVAIQQTRARAREARLAGSLRVTMDPRGLTQVLSRRLSCARQDPEGYSLYVRETVLSYLVETVQRMLTGTLHVDLTLEMTASVLQGGLQLPIPTPQQLADTYIARRGGDMTSYQVERIARWLWLKTSWLLAETWVWPRRYRDDAFREIVQAQIGRLQRLYRELAVPGLHPGVGEE
jgi:hypothetical protein